MPGPLLFTVVIVLIAGGRTVLSGAGIDEAAARKVSDAFMSDLIANKVGDAVNLMEPEYIRQIGRSEAEARMRKFFGYCGRPTDKELVDEQDTVKDYPGGREIPMKKFSYSATTTTYKKGNCWFTVGVVASPAGLRVAEYGALHQFAGEI